MANREVVICSPVRTAIGTYGGTLKEMPAIDLGAAVVRATLDRAKLQPGDIGTVVMGNVIQAGNKMNPARQAAIHGGVPVDVPAMTVNRVCGSGAQAIASAAQEIMLGFIDSAVAGGMENMDRAPYLMSSGRWGYRMGDAQIFDAMLMDGLNDAFSGQHSGWHTEDLARSHQITREEQDRWAERSQKRFSAAQSAGKFAAEIAAVEVASRKGPVKFDKDEHNRPDTTLESLSKLKPAFRKDGTITAGNAPGLNTGAAAMIVADRAWADKKGLQADGAPCRLRYRRRRAGHVRSGSGPGGEAGARSRRLEDRRCRVASRSMRPLRPSRLRSRRTSVCRRMSSTWKAAQSRMVTRSARRARCSRPVSCIRCSATGSTRVSSRSASAADRVSRSRSNL